LYTGISNMCGRAGAGLLATIPSLNILHFNNLSLIVSGLSTVLVTVLCTTHASMLVYAVVFGLSIGMSDSSIDVSKISNSGDTRSRNLYQKLVQVVLQPTRILHVCRSIWYNFFLVQVSCMQLNTALYSRTETARHVTRTVKRDWPASCCRA